MKWYTTTKKKKKKTEGKRREKGVKEGTDGRGEEKRRAAINADVFLRARSARAMFVLGNAITLSYKI